MRSELAPPTQRTQPITICMKRNYVLTLVTYFAWENQLEICPALQLVVKILSVLQAVVDLQFETFWSLKSIQTIMNISFSSHVSISKQSFHFSNAKKVNLNGHVCHCCSWDSVCKAGITGRRIFPEAQCVKHNNQYIRSAENMQKDNTLCAWLKAITQLLSLVRLAFIFHPGINTAGTYLHKNSTDTPFCAPEAV